MLLPFKSCCSLDRHPRCWIQDDNFFLSEKVFVFLFFLCYDVGRIDKNLHSQQHLFNYWYKVCFADGRLKGLSENIAYLDSHQHLFSQYFIDFQFAHCNCKKNMRYNVWYITNLMRNVGVWRWRGFRSIWKWCIYIQYVHIYT